MVQIFVMLILTQSNILNKTSDVDAADIRCLLGMRWLWFVEYFIHDMVLQTCLAIIGKICLLCGLAKLNIHNSKQVCKNSKSYLLLDMKKKNTQAEKTGHLEYSWKLEFYLVQAVIKRRVWEPGFDFGLCPLLNEMNQACW